MTIGDKVGQAGSYAREKAAAARSRASSVGSSGASTIDESPVIALVGGLVLGAIAAAVLPRTEREQRALGGTGSKLTERAKTAVQAARDAGQNKLGELGINKDSIGGAVKNLATSAAGAARQAAAGGGGGVTGGNGAASSSSSAATSTAAA